MLSPRKFDKWDGPDVARQQWGEKCSRSSGAMSERTSAAQSVEVKADVGSSRFYNVSQQLLVIAVSAGLPFGTWAEHEQVHVCVPWLVCITGMEAWHRR